MEPAEEVEVAERALKVAAPTWRRRLRLFAPVLLVLVVAVVWYFGDLRTLNSPEKVADAARALRESPYAIFYVLLAFVVGTLLFFPITALIAGTALAFEGLPGFLFAWAGGLAAAMMTYGLGRTFGSDLLAYVRGPKIERFQRELQTHALRASIAARFVPVGSFTLLNMLAGSMHVPFRWYVLGNIIGLFPGVLVMTLFAGQLSEALRHADKTSMIALAVGLVSAVGGWLAWRRWVKQRRGRARRLQSMAE